MANACILLKNGAETDDEHALSMLKALSANGYSFEEFHILSQTDNEKLFEVIDNVKRLGGSVFIFTEEEAERQLKACFSQSNLVLEKELEKTFGATVYELNGNSIEKSLVEILKQRNLKISVAESFTGGGIAKRITSVSGASQVYFEGLNTYNETSKIKRLGVSKATLDEKGAVSQETASEMVNGLLATGDCDIAIATTGLAGPNTDRSGLPVGLCFIAVGTKGHGQVRVHRYVFDGTRQEITEKAIDYALYHGYGAVKDL